MTPPHKRWWLAQGRDTLCPRTCLHWLPYPDPPCTQEGPSAMHQIGEQVGLVVGFEIPGAVSNPRVCW